MPSALEVIDQLARIADRLDRAGRNVHITATVSIHMKEGLAGYLQGEASLMRRCIQELKLAEDRAATERATEVAAAAADPGAPVIDPIDPVITPNKEALYEEV